MAIDYAVKYDLQNLVDEKFKLGAKSEASVNKDYDFTGGKSVKVYTIGTSTMNDYARTGSNRYGAIEDLAATTQEMLLSKDRSFTFAIDKMDADETKNAMNAATALERQIREVVIPEIDKYRFDQMAANAGNAATPSALDATNVYDAILAGTTALDDAEVPMEGRQVVVTPDTYQLMKKSSEIVLETEIGQELRNRGVIAMVDGMEVIKVPSSRIGTANFGFMVTHPVATTSPVKLAEYKIHEDAPGISGSLVEGRVYYDAFVLNNKANAIYLHTTA